LVIVANQVSTAFPVSGQSYFQVVNSSGSPILNENLATLTIAFNIIYSAT